MLLKKLLSTLAATLMFAGVMAFLGIHDDPFAEYHKGQHFMIWFSVYFTFAGVIILVYGNLVSAGMEELQRKYFREKNWLYLSLLGLFGIVPGLLFQQSGIAFYGMLVAIFYGVIDKFLSKGVMGVFVLIQAAALLLTFAYLELSSPAMPPFTKEQAVQSVTKDADTMSTFLFPKNIGKRESIIDGYHVTRATTARKIKKDVYEVTFIESWNKGTEKGSYHFSYEVERGGGFSRRESNGDVPPYYGEAAEDYKGSVVYP